MRKHELSVECEEDGQLDVQSIEKTSIKASRKKIHFIIYRKSYIQKLIVVMVMMAINEIYIYAVQ